MTGRVEDLRPYRAQISHFYLCWMPWTPGELVTRLHRAPDRDWTPLVGYLAYVAVLAAGYYYNLTFVQLGLIDLGVRRVGMAAQDVSIVMALFAVAAFAIAAMSGWVMDRQVWSSRLRVKLRLLFAVVSVQTLLTVVVVSVATPAGYVAWVVGAAVSIGVGMPVAFSLMIDFIPIRLRGAMAAVVAGVAFAAAAVYPLEWRIEEFAPVMAAVMIPAVAILGVVTWRRFDFVDRLSRQHERFGVGRFCHSTPVATASLAFWGPVVLMFSVFFIDSLGFLRIVDTPAYISTSWQSPDIEVRLFIAMAHLVGAAMAGVLYTTFGKRWLFVWTLGLFAFAHLLYTFHLATAPSGIDPPLLLPLFYVLAVSFYTTLNFALWPDLSTPSTIGVHTGLGVGIAGWLASFLSTSLALYSQSAGVSLFDHLRYVNSLALLLAVSLPVFWYFRRMRSLANVGEAS